MPRMGSDEEKSRTFNTKGVLKYYIIEGNDPLTTGQKIVQQHTRIAGRAFGANGFPDTQSSQKRRRKNRGKPTPDTFC